MNAGLLYALACLVLYWLLMTRTYWVLQCARSAANPKRRGNSAVPVFRIMLAVMFIAGGVAGLAGMVEVTTIQGRLVSELSPGYGFIGFLVSWLAGTPLAHRW